MHGVEAYFAEANDLLAQAPKELIEVLQQLHPQAMQIVLLVNQGLVRPTFSGEVSQLKGALHDALERIK